MRLRICRGRLRIWEISGARGQAPLALAQITRFLQLPINVAFAVADFGARCGRGMISVADYPFFATPHRALLPSI